MEPWWIAEIREKCPEAYEAMAQSPVRPSEALFAFCAWLSGREEPITVSRYHEVPPLPELIGEFCESQGWADPRGDFMSRISPYPDKPTD